jgi:predicted GNAT superfamily acetyltransferase
MSSVIEIRELTSNTELTLVQNLEHEIWNMDPLPLHQTITASQNGGLVLGAYFKEELVGFSYSFAGFNKGQSYLCSHMLGIHQEHREKGIGARLKQVQKEIALEMGYDLIVWTYDPLETRNGYLNLSKLQAICETYVENCYGEMEDKLNSGLPTDRFKVEWWINSSHVINQQTIKKDPAQSTFQWETTTDHLPKLTNIEDGLRGVANIDAPVLVPVPANFQQLKRLNNNLAIDWRFKTREIFQTLFAKGYAIVSLQKSENEPVHFYVLVPKKHLEIGR